MISRTAEYALRAVVVLGSSPGGPLTTHQIAEQTRVPSGYLSKVLQALGRAGLVEAERGLRGDCPGSLAGRADHPRGHQRRRSPGADRAVRWGSPHMGVASAPCTGGSIRGSPSLRCSSGPRRSANCSPSRTRVSPCARWRASAHRVPDPEEDRMLSARPAPSSDLSAVRRGFPALDQEMRPGGSARRRRSSPGTSRGGPWPRRDGSRPMTWSGCSGSC